MRAIDMDRLYVDLVGSELLNTIWLFHALVLFFKKQKLSYYVDVANRILFLKQMKWLAN